MANYRHILIFNRAVGMQIYTRPSCWAERCVPSDDVGEAQYRRTGHCVQKLPRPCVGLAGAVGRTARTETKIPSGCLTYSGLLQQYDYVSTASISSADKLPELLPCMIALAPPAENSCLRLFCTTLLPDCRRQFGAPAVNRIVPSLCALVCARVAGAPCVFLTTRASRMCAAGLTAQVIILRLV